MKSLANLFGGPRIKSAPGLSDARQSNEGSAVLKVWFQPGHAALVVPMLPPIVPYRGGVPKLSVLKIRDEVNASILLPTRSYSQCVKEKVCENND